MNRFLIYQETPDISGTFDSKVPIEKPSSGLSVHHIAVETLAREQAYGCAKCNCRLGLKLSILGQGRVSPTIMRSRFAINHLIPLTADISSEVVW